MSRRFPLLAMIAPLAATTAACARQRPVPAPRSAAGPAVAPRTGPGAVYIDLRENWPPDTTLAAYVIDGVRYDAGDSAGAYRPPRFPPIPAADVISITAVRGADAVARFGPGTAGGVVVVRTRAGARRPE